MGFIETLAIISTSPSTPLVLVGGSIGYMVEGPVGAVVVGGGIFLVSLIYYSAVIMSRNYAYK